MRNSIFFVLVVASIESGCGAKLPSVKPFKMEVQQGNVVTSKMLLQLRPGMTRSQVRYIMGTPLVVDSFRDNRWDYFYQLRKQGAVIEKRRVILDFDKDNLVSVRGDVVAAGDNPDVKTIAESPQAVTQENQNEAGWTDKLKFWKEEAEAKNQQAANTAPNSASELKTAKVAPAAELAASAPKTVSQPEIAVKPQQAADLAPVGPTAEDQAAIEENEVVPFIPEGEYNQAPAPSPAEMAKGNLPEANLPSVPAEASKISEKGVASNAKAAESVAVFEQETLPEAPAMAASESVMPPLPAPSAVGAVKAETAKPTPAKPEPAKPVIAATAIAAAALAQTETSGNTTISAKPLPSVVAETKAEIKTETTTAMPPVAEPVIEEEEVVPFIPEGEYAEPVIPSPDEMVKGNAPASNTPVVDAATHVVTEKGVEAKENAEVAGPPPVFIAEKLPEPVEEPELTLPPPKVVKPSLAKVPEAKVDTTTVPPPVPVPAAPVAVPAAPVVVAVPPAAIPVPSVVTPVPPVVAPVAALPVPASPVASSLPTQAIAAIESPTSKAQAETKEVSKSVTVPMRSTMKAEANPPVQVAVSQDAPAGEADINAAVDGWAQAWRSKNIAAYLGAYAPEFVAEGLPNRRAWEAQRKQRLSVKQGQITLVLNNVNVQRDGNTAVVQFEQKYAAKSYKDELLKTLEMRYEATQKRWLITHERVTPLALAAPVAAVAKPEAIAPSSAVTLPKAEVAETLRSAQVQSPAVVADGSVESAVQTWAQAWRSKNISAYLSAYAPDFVPDGLPSKSAWEGQRKQRLSPKQGPITLEIGALNVQKNGNEAVVTFTQKYASKVYRDEMVKKLVLRYSAANHSWLIVRETSSADTPSAATKQQVTAPEGSAEHLDGVLEQIGF